jgi:hypothetical protein
VVDRLHLAGSLVAFDRLWSTSGTSLLRLTEASVAPAR